MLNDIVKKISSDAGIDEQHVMRMIEDKKDELSGLISEEGAAYIVAKELGVAMIKQERLDIAHIIPGMQNVDVVGKVTKISAIREFSTEKAKGRVANVTVADETGSVRLSLWNDEIEAISGIEPGDVVRARGYVKEDNIGNPEIRIGRYGSIVKSSEGISKIKETRRMAERTTISGLIEGGYRQLRAPLLQIFESNIFYERCPECKSRIRLDENDNFSCSEHGVIEEPNYGMIISGIADDGTGSIRVVFFNENAEHLLGMTTKDAKKLFDKKKKLEAIIGLIPLGKDFIFEGRAQHNKLFDRLEFIVNDMKLADVRQEIEVLLNNLAE